MRNGNCMNESVIGIFTVVLILPMRNGNYLEIVPQLEQMQGSYPTYEEWKLNGITPVGYELTPFLSYL